MKKTRLLTLLVAVLISVSTTSCLKQMVKSAAKSAPVANKILLHSSPRVGDYAIYKVVPSAQSQTDPSTQMMQGETTTEIRIVGKVGNLFKINQTTNTTMIASRFMNDLVFELHSDAQGNIKKAFMIDKSSKERSELQIAKPGDKAYNLYNPLSSTEISKYRIPTKVTVPAGTFYTKAYSTTKNRNADEGFTVNLYSSKAKFQLTATYVVYNDPETGKIKAERNLELIEQGRK